MATLLAGTSIAGVMAMALLNGQPLDPDSISGLLQTILAALANGYLAHAFYKRVAQT